jgi:outer membrane lipoprotein SlyB
MTKEAYQKKASAIGKLVNAAGIKELWEGLTEAQRRAIIGGGIGAGVGGAAGAGVGALTDSSIPISTIIGLLAGGGLGAGAGYYGTPDRVKDDDLESMLKDIKDREYHFSKALEAINKKKAPSAGM